MSDIYRRGIRTLHQDDSEPFQLMFHIDAVSSDAVPLLQALEVEPDHQISQSWLHDCAEILGQLVLHLREAAKKMTTRLVVYHSHY